MAESHAADKPRAVDARTLDRGLNAAVIVLVVGILVLTGLFGYRVYADRQRSEQSAAATRVIRALEGQVRQNPNDAILRVRLGEALGAAGKFDEAIEQLNAALQIEPEHPGAFLDLGMIAVLTDNNSEAREYFKKVIEVTSKGQYANVDERQETAYYNIGLLDLEEEAFEDAAGNFKAALRIRKDASDTYYHLAKAYQGLGDPESAIKNLEIAVSFDPGYAAAHFALGELYLEKDDLVNASYYLTRAAERAPDAEQPQEALASIGPVEQWKADAQEQLAAKQVESALTSVLIARNLDSKDPELAKLQGAILVARGDLKDALDVYEAALKLDPKDAEAKAKVAELKKQLASDKK